MAGYGKPMVRRLKTMMVSLRPALIAALLLLCSALPALAQSERIVIDDPDGIFEDAGAVRAAAEQLAAEDVDVIVVAVADAGVGDEAPTNYLDTRLRTLNVANGISGIDGNQIVFFVAPRPGYDGVFFAERYTSTLEPVIDQLRLERMRPQFARGDFSAGMAAGIDAVRTTLNPPPSPVPWVVGGAAAAGLAGAAGASALRRRKAAEAVVATARGRMEEARRTAGGAIADLGRRVTLAREKAQYDRLSYAPHDVEQIVTLQTRGEARFAEAQQVFDGAEETRTVTQRLTEADYSALADRFSHAQRLVEEATQLIEQAEQRRLVLDQSSTPHTGPTQHLH